MQPDRRVGRKKKIILMGKVPPPYIGPAIATEIILHSRLKEEFELIHLDTSDHRGISTLGAFDLTNILLPVKHCFLLFFYILRHRPAAVYFPNSQTTIAFWRDLPFLIIAKLFGRKVICHLRGGNFRNWYQSASRLTRWAVRRFHPLVDGQIVLGRGIVEHFSWLLPEHKIFVVPNGGDYPSLGDGKERDRKGRGRVLFLANYIRSKGVLDFLFATQEIFAHYPQVEFAFAGEWRDEMVRKEFLSYLLQHPELPISVRGTVSGEAKYDLLRHADVFVFPTYYENEGHPWVIVEAMAAGLPVISTDQGVIAESVGDGVNGFIIEKKRPDQIAAKVLCLLQSRQVRTDMGSNSRKIYEERYTESCMADSLRACFNSILSGRKQRGSLILEDRLYKHVQLYKNLPPLLKYPVGIIFKRIPKRIRYGKAYFSHKQLLERSRHWRQDEIDAYQLEQLNFLLGIARRKVPFYRDVLQKTVWEIRSIDEFQKAIPTLSKEQLRNRPEEFINDEFDRKKLITFSTSGTTGEPLKVFYEKGLARVKEAVYMSDLWRRLGYSEGDRLAVFRSAMLKKGNRANQWDYDPIKNRYLYSTFDLTEDRIRFFLRHLEKKPPKYLHVYPSALTIIASFMKTNRIASPIRLRGIFSGSENTFPHQIALFNEVFGSPVLRWYGLGEMACLAGSCEKSHLYHVYPTYSFVELVAEDGTQVKEIGQTGEIVGTTFDNLAMPLIRYRTGDFAVFGGSRCPECGRAGLMFKEIEGRRQEFIVDIEGNEYSLGTFLFGIHEEMWANISAIQFEQMQKGMLTVFACSARLAFPEIKSYVYKTLQPRFFPNFSIEVVPVDKIERTAAGKQRYLIQHLEVNTCTQ